MKNIWEIFRSDLRGLFKNFFALTIALGLCLIPSLYAWFNIYSNWDPYANTGAVKIAVFSEDAGYKAPDKTYENMGDNVIDNLKGNDKLGWTFPETKEAAIEGVEKGDFYAAIVIGENFSKSMVDFIENGMERPSVVYYENSKKNAIASKITQSGMSSLQETINEEFIEAAVVSVLDSSSLKDLIDNSFIDDTINKLDRLADNLNSYHLTITYFMDSTQRLSDSINNTNELILKLQDRYSEAALNDSRTSSQTTIDDYMKQFDDALEGLKTANAEIIKKVDEVSDLLERYKNGDASVSKEDIDDALGALGDAIDSSDDISDDLKNELDDLLGNRDINKPEFDIPEFDIPGLNISKPETLDAAGDAIDAMENSANDTLDGAKDYFDKVDSPEAIALLESSLKLVKDSYKQINDLYDGTFSVSVEDAKVLIKSSVDYIYDSLIIASKDLSYFSDALTGSAAALGNVNSVMSTTDGVITGITEKISDYRDILKSFSEGTAYDTILGIINKDSKDYGEFFSAPVSVTTVPVYVELNYGSAVAPFYTTLAIWVGGLILTAIIKTSPADKEKFKDYPLYQQYFGRYLIFFFMGQAQAIITVVGNLIVFHTICVHPVLLGITASIVSFTFTILIYTLALSFGDVGKAIAVVVVVIQIAGSSGTFPIELLPEFFQRVYIYFPFPYAINAMRECISGTYQANYIVYILKLLIFAGASILVGLVIRKPFMKLNHYMHKRMHKTGFM